MDYVAVLLIYGVIFAIAAGCFALAIALRKRDAARLPERTEEEVWRARAGDLMVGCLLFVGFGIGACGVYFLFFFSLY